jgi:hypothetical protein
LYNQKSGKHDNLENMVEEHEVIAWSLTQLLSHTNVIHKIGTTLYLAIPARLFPSARLSFKTYGCDGGAFGFDAYCDSKENIYRIFF